MPMHYSNPKRESDPHAIPDVETFYVSPEDARKDTERRESGLPSNGEPFDAGWYWWTCIPGCLPDSDPVGPFKSEDAALADARNGMDDDEA